MITIGRLVNKIIVTKENINELRYNFDDISNISKRFKPGDNLYRVARYSNGNPYDTYTISMTRDDVVDCIKSGQLIIGLKLDKAGRLIENHNAEDINSEQYKKIKEKIISYASKGQYSISLKDSVSEFDPEEKIIYKILPDECKDTWSVFDVILGIAKEVASENNWFIGGVYASDELHNVCIASHYENVISYLTSEYQSICSIQELDKDYVLDRLNSALNSNKNNLIEPWIDFGSFNFSSNIESALVLDAVGKIGKDAEYEASGDWYGENGVWYNELTSKVIKNLVERVRHNQPAYEIKILMKNIKVFSNCRFKANSPQETFKKYIKEALSGHGCNTQTIEDYIDMALAIQEIYYKNPENIHCDEEGVILIEKAKVKIERKPYVLTVSKI